MGLDLELRALRVSSRNVCCQPVSEKFTRLIGTLIICSSFSAVPGTLTMTLLSWSSILGVAVISRMKQGLKPVSEESEDVALRFLALIDKVIGRISRITLARLCLTVMPASGLSGSAATASRFGTLASNAALSAAASTGGKKSRSYPCRGKTGDVFALTR